MMTNNSINEKEPLITAIMCTYGRFSFVERAVNFFLNQSYKNKKLIIFNTATEDGQKYNYYLKDTYTDKYLYENFGIIIINNSIDYVTGLPYTNVGAIRRDALTHAAEDGYHVTWDDDDVFLPWFMNQAIDRMAETGLPSFKPQKSFFYSGGHLRLCQNTLEASVVADIKKVREYGFLLETGKEGLGWYTKMRDNKELDENDTNYIPSYCFDWNSGTDIHRQSGDIDNPQNFVNHKKRSDDHVNSRMLRIYSFTEMIDLYKPYIEFLNNQKEYENNKWLSFYNSDTLLA